MQPAKIVNKSRLISCEYSKEDTKWLLNLRNKRNIDEIISHKQIEQDYKEKLHLLKGEEKISFTKGIDNLIYTFDHNLLKKADVFIITVPTPIDDAKSPDFKYIE